MVPPTVGWHATVEHPINNINTKFSTSSKVISIIQYQDFDDEFIDNILNCLYLNRKISCQSPKNFISKDTISNGNE